MDSEKLQTSLDRMRQLASPEDGVFAIAPLEETGMPGVLSNVLRVFRAIQFDRGRRPSRKYDPDFDKFAHVLSDSPTSIANKMKADWRDYAHHAIVQIGVCNFRCFYCYVDFRYLTGRNVVHVDAEQILDQFLARREELAADGVQLNVLRVSGGEPMLAPDLTLDLLGRVRERGLEGEICIKTETNLSPLVRAEDGTCAAERWADLEAFKEYGNFIMHPTFHGIDQNSLRRISTARWDSFEMIISALHNLLRYEIDFFPSFGANVIAADDVEPFFERIKAVHPNLPARVAVRKFHFYYEAPATRKHGKRDVMTHDHVKTIGAWDALLQREYGIGYGEVPRHEFSLN